MAALAEHLRRSTQLELTTMPPRTNSQTPTGTTDRQLDSLVALLSDSPMLVISGEKIASEIGVSRSTVWRWITRLRELGVRVKGHPSSGYHIERVPDILVPNILRRRLAGTPFAKRIHHLFKVDSTNRVALELGQQDEPHGALVVAEEQFAGRGRTSRVWLSEKSAGIYMSILLRPKLTPVQAPALTLAAGLAARDAVAEQSGVEADIRWPNDVLLNEKKLCGILTEMYAEPDRIKFVVIGIGLNVNHAKMPAAIASIATSLRIETGRVHERIELVQCGCCAALRPTTISFAPPDPRRLSRVSWKFPATPPASAYALPRRRKLFFVPRPDSTRAACFA